MKHKATADAASVQGGEQQKPEENCKQGETKQLLEIFVISGTTLTQSTHFYFMKNFLISKVYCASFTFTPLLLAELNHKQPSTTHLLGLN